MLFAPFVFVMACTPEPLKVDATLAHDFPTSNTPTSSSTGDQQTAALTASWDGTDGLIVEWLEATDNTIVSLYEKTGSLLQQETSTDTIISFTGLAEGEYTITMEQRLPDGTEASQTIDQYVGSNRLLYRSELPLFRAMDVWGEGDIAVLAGGKNDEVSVLVADISDPEDPQIITTMTDIGYVRDIKIGDGLLFTTVDPDSDGCTLCDDIGVRIFDFQDPENPVLLSTIGVPAHAVHNISYSNGFLYVCSIFESNLVVYDVRDPTNPTRIATWYAQGNGPVQNMAPDPGGSHDVTALGDRLYIAHVFGFSIVDISDPYYPVELASQSVNMGTHNVWPNEDETILAVTEERAGGPLTLWDISDMSDIQKIFSHATDDLNCVHNAYFADNILYAAWYVDGVFVYELGEDSSPTLTGSYDTYDGEIQVAESPNGIPLPPINGAWGVWPFGDHIYVGDTERGLLIFDYYPISVAVY